MKTHKIIIGDNVASMREMPDNSVDSIVTDPPYGLAFMGKRWDYDVPGIETWRECLRVLKPGGYLLAFGGSRTYHRLVIPIEDAGFEIRDQILWLYGSGFPKSHNVSKAIDKAAGAEREVVGTREKLESFDYKGNNVFQTGGSAERVTIIETAPATPDDAKRWDGWGTALKPAHEPIVMARKPFSGTVAANVLRHGTGALNIDGCRVAGPGALKWPTPRGGYWAPPSEWTGGLVQGDKGRWPANLIHDGSDEVLALFPETKVGGGVRRPNGAGRVNTYTGGWGADIDYQMPASEGSAARYFYCAKASKRDRDEGLDMLPEQRTAAMNGNLTDDQRLAGDGTPISTPIRRNVHPTVKPTQLMRYLCRLVTPPGGVVLDPFCGSGSTGKAAMLEGFRFIGCELDPDYVEIAEARCAHAARTHAAEAEEQAAASAPPVGAQLDIEEELRRAEAGAE